ncbi:unnamed protein product [Prunus brigantina]
MPTVRCLLTIAAVSHWPLHQRDVNNAFLHGDLCGSKYLWILGRKISEEEDRIFRRIFFGDKNHSHNLHEEIYMIPPPSLRRHGENLHKILKDAKLLCATPIDFPMEKDLKLSDKGEFLKDPAHYRRLVGCLIYLTITRPDITYYVHVLSMFMHAPRKPHMEAALCILRYLKNTSGQGILLSS